MAAMQRRKAERFIFFRKSCATKQHDYKKGLKKYFRHIPYLGDENLEMSWINRNPALSFYIHPKIGVTKVSAGVSKKKNSDQSLR